ncbi:MAG: hypothetical protein COZ18_15695 [Flexibacter sp. CG_4_10_14_3_um_filter_32_15]|nr:MAG: hypothetical protein COZ18_15695 [Flexibacter sp. CG_4_10_14_3_um_filter_32_15]
MSEEDVLLEKLVYFRREHAIEADAKQKFALKKRIEEIEERLEKIRYNKNCKNYKTVSKQNDASTTSK